MIMDVVPVETKTMQDLLDEVCVEARVTPAIMRGTSRRAAYIDARRLFIWRAHKELGKSLEQISYFLMRDRSTVMHHMEIMDDAANIDECRATIRRMSRAKATRVKEGA